MQKKLTITIDEDVYAGLYSVIGRRHISQFIENLVRPHVIDADLEAGYKHILSIYQKCSTYVHATQRNKRRQYRNLRY